MKVEVPVPAAGESPPLLLTPRQHDLVEGALRIVDREGAAGLTMRSIAGELGLSPMAAYKHFDNQRLLLLEVWRRCMRELATEVREALATATCKPGECFMLVLRSTVAYAVRHPNRFALVFSNALISDARRDPRFDADRVSLWLQAASVLESARASGEIRSDLPPDQLLIFSTAVVQGLSLNLIADRVNAMTTLAEQAAIDGILTLVHDALRPR